MARMPLTAAHTYAQKRLAARRNKFNAVATTVDGIRFDSKREASVYATLKTLERAGKISDLLMQFKYDLYVSGKRIGEYRADFVFKENGQMKAVDVKGCDTALSRWKRRHVAAQYGLEVEIWK